MYEVKQHRIENSIWNAFVRFEQDHVTKTKAPPELFAIDFLSRFGEGTYTKFYFDDVKDKHKFRIVVRIQETDEVLFDESYDYTWYDYDKGLPMVHLITRLLGSKEEIQAKVERFKLNLRHADVLNSTVMEAL